ncbi:TetR/AcrR family transcriptional regulator [Arthrobacter glacialis]|uniref:TetR/AcrR family transcriptional regulator n=1 Tax=Arthrobacter glacialis TaxID=1664 RepID=A0A2S3ZRZ6_ARTGL|nr:TetR/AcrR family transcriptional regulator [Arthrobacter glacialis]POH57654.1 TetR/AcrR family transcriptional regulator [Arthrobacter glacialis]POH71884.1 TetR/AcrR family transcriptional regulator [Arthrobacter glacialis]
MAWDTARTRTLLLDAATEQFAQKGLAGTRVDAVARDAGVNKERIYQYFGNKEGLFDAVLLRALECFLMAVPLEGNGIAAVGEFAGCLFDEYTARPQLPRLLAWEGLERGDREGVTDPRAGACAENAALIRAACPQLSGPEATQLLLSIVTLATGWWALPQLGEIMSGDGVDARRAAVVAQASAMAAGPGQ